MEKGALLRLESTVSPSTSAMDLKSVIYLVWKQINCSLVAWDVMYIFNVYVDLLRLMDFLNILWKLLFLNYCDYYSTN